MGFRSLKVEGRPTRAPVIAVVAGLVGEFVDGPKPVEMWLAASPASSSTATVPAASGS